MPYKNREMHVDPTLAGVNPHEHERFIRPESTAPSRHVKRRPLSPKRKFSHASTQP